MDLTVCLKALTDFQQTVFALACYSATYGIKDICLALLMALVSAR